MACLGILETLDFNILTEAFLPQFVVIGFIWGNQSLLTTFDLLKLIDYLLESSGFSITNIKFLS